MAKGSQRHKTHGTCRKHGKGNTRARRVARRFMRRWEAFLGRPGKFARQEILK